MQRIPELVHNVDHRIGMRNDIGYGNHYGIVKSLRGGIGRGEGPHASACAITYPARGQGFIFQPDSTAFFNFALFLHHSQFSSELIYFPIYDSNCATIDLASRFCAARQNCVNFAL